MTFGEYVDSLNYALEMGHVTPQTQPEHYGRIQRVTLKCFSENCVFIENPS